MQRLIVRLKKIEIVWAVSPESEGKHVPNYGTQFCSAASTVGGPKSSEPFRRLDYVPKLGLIAFILYPNQTLYTVMPCSIQSGFEKREDKEHTPLSRLSLQDYER